MEQKTFMLPTEIGKDEICLIAEIKKAKLNRLILAKQYNFPLSVRVVNRCIVFDRSEVIEWMKTNDMQKMRVVSLMQRAEPVKNEFNNMVKLFLNNLDLLRTKH